MICMNINVTSIAQFFVIKVTIIKMNSKLMPEWLYPYQSPRSLGNRVTSPFLLSVFVYIDVSRISIFQRYECDPHTGHHRLFSSIHPSWCIHINTVLIYPKAKASTWIMLCRDVLHSVWLLPLMTITCPLNMGWAKVSLSKRYFGYDFLGQINWVKST